MGLGDKLRKLMVIDASDQVSYCNRTVQVGSHVLVVTCATLDSTGEGLGPSFVRSNLQTKKYLRFQKLRLFVSDISRATPALTARPSKFVYCAAIHGTKNCSVEPRTRYLDRTAFASLSGEFPQTICIKWGSDTTIRNSSIQSILSIPRFQLA